jgi:hypothetical protein
MNNVCLREVVAQGLSAALQSEERQKVERTRKKKDTKKIERARRKIERRNKSRTKVWG